MDGNSKWMGDALTPANAPETPIQKKLALRLIQSRKNTVLSGCFMETLPEAERPPCQLFQ